METKRELNDILINDDDLQQQNRTKKLMMMVGVAIIILCILIAVIFVITRGEEDLSEKTIADNNGLTSMGSTPIQEPQNGGFVNVPIDNNTGSDDRFQQILDDIRNRNGDSNNQVAQNTTQQPTAPSTPPLTTPTQNQPKPTQQTTQPKPTQQTNQNQPVLPNNTTSTKKPEPSKPAQTASNTTSTNTTKKPEPAKSAPAPTQTQPPKPQPTQTATPTNSVANAFEGVATSPATTSPMDRSKNGQVATKGFYVQVGSFANKPSEEFLKKIGNYSYRVYAGTSSNGQQTTKYLIGPYNSRTEAARDLPNFKSLVADPVHFEVK